MSKVIHPNEKRILFSHEGLFILILFNITVFADIFIKFNIKIILFIRDPIDHMLSRYSQGLKRSGNAHSVDHTAEKYNLVQEVGQFIDVCKKLNFELRVLNYSNRSHYLISAFEEALCISPKTLPPLTKNIKRSLTRSEIEIQRLFNLYFNGKSSKFISDVLCNELSNIRPEKKA